MIVRDNFLKWINRDPLRYHSLHADMVSARVGMTLEKYLWRSFKIAFLSGILFALLGYVASVYLSLRVLTGRTGLYNVLNIQLPVVFSTLYPGDYMQVIIVIVSFIVGTLIGYNVLLRLPALQKNNRKIKINLTLHNAVAYMYAMRRGGAQMMTIFSSLSDRANIYGEVALEFRQMPSSRTA